MSTNITQQDGINGASGTDLIHEGDTDGPRGGSHQSGSTPARHDERVPLAAPFADFFAAAKKISSEVPDIELRKWCLDFAMKWIAQPYRKDPVAVCAMADQYFEWFKKNEPN